jgi:hypothetical protein
VAARPPRLDPAKRARFDHDDAALERLVAAANGPTWAHVRDLRRYTLNFNPAIDAELRADAARADGDRPARRAQSPLGRYDRRGVARIPRPATDAPAAPERRAGA